MPTARSALRVTLFVALLAAFSLMTIASAHAQSSSASAEVTGLSYQLIDLDPTANITPGISFTERIDSISYYDNSSGNIDYQESMDFSPTSITRSFGSASTTADRGNWRAAARFDLATPYFQLFSAQNFYGVDFELTPSTGLLLLANVALTAAHAGASTRSEASARMFGYLNFVGNEAFEGSDFNDRVGIESGSRAYYLSGYLHSGTDALQGTFGIDTVATATFYGAAPVPEPQTYTLLLAGVGLLGWLTRRAGRRQRG